MYLYPRLQRVHFPAEVREVRGQQVQQRCPGCFAMMGPMIFAHSLTQT